MVGHRLSPFFAPQNHVAAFLCFLDRNAPPFPRPPLYLAKKKRRPVPVSSFSHSFSVPKFLSRHQRENTLRLCGSAAFPTKNGRGQLCTPPVKGCGSFRAEGDSKKEWNPKKQGYAEPKKTRRQNRKKVPFDSSSPASGTWSGSLPPAYYYGVVCLYPRASSHGRGC